MPFPTSFNKANDELERIRRDHHLQMGESDWAGRPRVLWVRTEPRLPQILQTIVYTVEDLSSLGEQTGIDSVTIQDAEGNEEPFKNYIQLFSRELSLQQPGERYGLTFLRRNAKLVSDQHTIAINGIGFEGILHSFPGPRMHPTDEIWLLMKNIFENASYTITRLGRIQKDPIA